MFAIVYRSRREGHLLDAETVRAQPARGELRVERKGMRRVAVLLAADDENHVIPLLDKPSQGSPAEPPSRRSAGRPRRVAEGGARLEVSNWLAGRSPSQLAQRSDRKGHPTAA